MGKVTRVLAHLSAEEVREKIQQTQGSAKVQKWLVIWNALVDPRPAEQIARQTGLAESTVHNLVSAYNRHGPMALAGPGKGGRRRAYLTPAKETQLLEGLKPAARAGRLTTAAILRQELSRQAGCPVSESTAYRMLHRHGWRKVTPRPRHVRADAAVQEEFKKNSRNKPRSSWGKSSPGIPAR